MIGESDFGWPGGLVLLLIPPLVWVALNAVDRARARQIARVIGPRSRIMTAEVSRKRRRLRRGMMALGLLLVFVAFLQPSFGESEGEGGDDRGVDLLICLDVSRSMLARDVAPSRLEAARREIRALAERVRGDRIGLVVFAGEARLMVPLTQDVSTFLHLLELADPLSVNRGGTDIGAALAAAGTALEGTTGEHEAVLLITDGEDLEQRGLHAATELKERGITVHAIGLGTRRGSKVVIEGQRGDSFLRTKAGDEVISSLDPESLLAISGATGGEFVDGVARPLPLVSLYERRIVPMARKSFGSAGRRGRANHFQWPLLLAVILFTFELGLSDRRARHDRERRLQGPASFARLQAATSSRRR